MCFIYMFFMKRIKIIIIIIIIIIINNNKKNAEKRGPNNEPCGIPVLISMIQDS